MPNGLRMVIWLLMTMGLLHSKDMTKEKSDSIKICLITLSTPTFNNVGSASALPYHLILGAKENKDVEFVIYSFNINEIDAEGIKQTEQQLGAKVHLLSKPLWLQWMFKMHLLLLRVFLGRPLWSYLTLPAWALADIRAYKPDKVWVYGEEIARLAKHFDSSRTVVTMPDCESLYYYRLLELPWISLDLRKILRYSFAYWQYKRMEHTDSIQGVTYHFVGKADADFYQRFNPDAHVVFIPHPLYAHRPKDISFHRPRIRLLFAGRYDFYCQHGSDKALQAMMNRANELYDHFEVTFLGKGWLSWADKLSGAGFTTQHIPYVKDYIEELQRHDIQINIIDVGTGTKGKVLDAISNGLLVIGSPLALENIAVKDGESCVQCIDYLELPNLLKNIVLHSDKYEKMAETGLRTALAEHGRRKRALELFGLCRNK